MDYTGDFVATSEELAPSEGVVEEDGSIYASVPGERVIDQLAVSVRNPKAARGLRKGDVVYGLVQDTYESVSLIEFEPVDKSIAVPNNFAYLRISEVQKRYTESFAECLRIGDFIKAKIVEVKPLGIYLTIAWPELGVVKAYCSQCRTEMKDEGMVFVCRNCGSTERRKKPV